VSVFAAFALVQLLTSIPITPAGLGVAEAAYITLLTAASRATLTGQIAAAAIIYRILSWLIVIPIGALAWAWWATRTPTADRIE
jgi:putative heme transporter